MKIVTVVGARPQFIKAAAVSRAIRKYNSNGQANRIEEIIVHTGQHYDYNMSEVFFEELDIPSPDYNLEVGSGPHGQQTGRMLEAIEKVLDGERPDWVLVYGDTNSTLAGALAAAKMHIPVAHVEAGLRSFNRKMPEEINRVLTDHVSRLLFCPTKTSAENLKKEGIIEGIHWVGDVMFDCILHYRSITEDTKTTLSMIGIEKKAFALATVHRAENTDSSSSLREIFEAFRQISEQIPVVVALHPRTRKYLDDYNIEPVQKVIILDPLSYLHMIELECAAYVILTDSGGVQKEAFFAGTPCITMREETEWVETVECGANVLCGSSKIRILDAYETIKKNKHKIDCEIDIYGNGEAARKIVNILVSGN